MGDRFSFKSADELIQLLKTAHTVLGNQSDKLMLLYKHLGNAFKDDGYLELMGNMKGAYSACQSTRQQLGVIIASIAKYKEQLYQLYIEDLITQIGFENISYESTVRFGAAGKELETKNRQLAFQNEVKMKIQQRELPDMAKRVYASIGSKCETGSDVFKKTACYKPGNGKIYFNLQADFHNVQGQLATYFHEIGHSIDHQREKKSWLSDDESFRNAIHSDFEKHISNVQQRFSCDRLDAYWHIRQRLNENSNLLTDISDIMGGLTQCQCQGIWGHDKKYWKKDKSRIYKEAFANMYSTALGSAARIEAMKRYFPTAYKRFEELLEGIA